VKTAPQRGGAQTPAVSISALQGSQAVLVKCNPKDFADIEATVKQLDSEGAAFGEVTKVIPLLYGDATEAQQALEKTLKKPESAGSRGGELLGDARVSVLTQSNAVVVSGTKEVVARIEGMVKEWDDAGEKGSVPQIIQLKHVEPGQIAASLQDMFAQQPTTQRGKVPPVIIPDEANRSLLVRSSLQDLTVIESLVAKMDLEGRKYENFFVVQVAQGTDVEDLADKVETSVNESAQRRPGQRGRDAPSLTATPDRRTNSIILAGSPSLFADARQLIQAMEKMTPPGGKTIRVISADTVPVDDLKRLIDQLQGDQQGRRGGGGGSRPSGGGTRRPRSEPARPGP
jgi:type II secretory pathway component GspD/PulD (secretin)